LYSFKRQESTPPESASLVGGGEASYGLLLNHGLLIVSSSELIWKLNPIARAMAFGR
jgi:hypothetical protein